MRRRAVLGLTTALLAAPPALFAQASQRRHRLAVFQFDEDTLSREHMRVFRERLKQLGFDEGRNLQLTEGLVIQRRGSAPKY